LKAACCPAEQEIETVIALAERFPRVHASHSIRSAWLLKDAIRCCRGMHKVLAYAEDPCGAEERIFRPRRMAEFRRATGCPPRRLVATDWRELRPPWNWHAVDISLGGSAFFWTMQGFCACGAAVPRLGPTWVSIPTITSISRSRVTRCRRRTGENHRVDTHWIWQDGQR